MCVKCDRTTCRELLPDSETTLRRIPQVTQSHSESDVKPIRLCLVKMWGLRGALISDFAIRRRQLTPARKCRPAVLLSGILWPVAWWPRRGQKFMLGWP